MSRQTRPVIRSPGGAAEAADPVGGILGISPALLLALFMGSMFIPAEFRVAGVRLTPYTSLLIIFILPMFLYFLRDRTNRIIALDLLILAFVVWSAIAIFYNNGPSRIIFIFNQTVSYLGGYMIGRVLIRRSTDYERFFRYFFYALVFFLPFAVIELLTKRMIISEVFATFSEVLPRAGNEPRLGLNRVQAFLEHAITYGLFCSIGVANLYYIYRGRLFKQMSRTGVAAFMTFISLSSAPNIAMGLQILLIAWDRMLARVRHKWVMLIIILAVVLSVLQLSAPRGVVGLVIDNLAFDPGTGWGRAEILQYAGAEALRHPLFGIGLDAEWIRPHWRNTSVDNFWLATALRYGLPALILLWLGLGLHAARIMARRGLSDTLAGLRTGYVIAWVGMIFILCTVFIWGAATIFVMAYIGAGAWFYTGPETERPPVRHRRARELRDEAAAARAAGPLPAAARDGLPAPAGGGAARPRSNPVRSRPIRSGPIRSGPIRSDTARSDLAPSRPGFARSPHPERN